ncbi:putative short-subunit dehydrogenase-like oxidoreductase (DUF2520 family) [Pedobacter sp. CAN_A7]|uniref:Rossmann-like and DUF2520 domain-containing protein n=1 Tax=Pedobacter sp. CAN_A7 TaxID=2787722 RepID=UPI0018C96452
MKVVCLGSGNVATHLASAFKASGADLIQVYSKTLANAHALASVLNSQAIDNLQLLNREADLYLISVSDDAIAGLVGQLNWLKGLVVHTSGATSLSVFEDQGISHYGVLYPLQTFSKSRPVDFQTIPLCLEAGTSEDLQTLHLAAATLSTLVYNVSSADRKLLHLAAVFACNFSNHLYHLSADLLARNHLSFDLLKPLILETAAKVQSAKPYDVQTGPAIRGDEATMNRHLELLQEEPVLTDIYKTLSKSIKKTYL